MALADQFMPGNLDPADRALYRSIFNSVFADTKSTVKAQTAAAGTLSRVYLGMSVKSLMSGDYLAGWCIKFGSPNVKDRANPATFFSSRTNFYLDQYPHIPTQWRHSKETVGQRSSYSIHKFGIWASTRLADGRRKKSLIEQARAGLLGYSTGTIEHVLNDGGFDPYTGEILAWPWVETSICPFSEIAEPGLGCLVIDIESTAARADKILEISIRKSVERLGDNQRV